MHMTGTVQRKTNTETDKATIPQSKSCGKKRPQGTKATWLPPSRQY